MKRILVPCDFSAPAQEAFKFAVAIARQSNGVVHVLYVIDVPFLKDNPIMSHGNVLNLEFMQDIEQKAKEQFETLRKLNAPPTLSVNFTVDINPLVLSVETCVREKQIDLVIMGGHSSSDSIWGTNSSKIVRYSQVPVITIRENSHQQIENIVVPIGPIQYHESLEKELKKLQAFFNAKIHFLWINTPLIFKTDVESKREMQHYVQASKFENYTINVLSDYNVEAGIFRFAKEKKADMIAMGTHAWKGLVRNLTINITEGVVSHAAFPIWTYDMNQKR
ncbi:MAG: universal stress protein [Bacteroidetes bacterium]|nr:universal stress protein [Bacteroidota bacterium]MBI3482505.1 universal stress protein [Bacteroidota bacterium]